MTTLPLLGFHFNVSFGDGQVFDDVSFSEVSVIDLEMLTKESCSMVNSEHLLSPSGFKYSDLELKRGKAVRESLLFKWLDIQVVNQKKLPITILKILTVYFLQNIYIYICFIIIASNLK